MLRSFSVNSIDYRQYYYLEQYLFTEVTNRFERSNKLNSFDFFCIIIWKANRAKSKVAERLLSKGHDDLDAAISALTSAIANERDERDKIKILMLDWGFRLPMASAILTVLHPTMFTVYDVRV